MFFWMGWIWTKTWYFWRQSTHWHGRVQDKHQSKSVWTIWTAWGLRPPEPCLLDLSTLQVWKPSHTRDPTLHIQRWGIFCWSQFHLYQVFPEDPPLHIQTVGWRNVPYRQLLWQHPTEPLLWVWDCWKKEDSTVLLCTDLLCHLTGESTLSSLKILMHRRKYVGAFVITQYFLNASFHWCSWRLYR